MEDAVMLFNGQVVPLSAVSDYENFNPNDPNLLFFDNYYEDDINGVSINRTGRVRRFKKGTSSYMAIFDKNSGLFVGYYSEKKFWENNFIDDSRRTTLANYKFNLGERFSFILFSPYNSQMKVYFGYKFIDINQQNQNINLVYNYRFALYQEISHTSNLDNLPTHSNDDNLLQAISLPVLQELNYYGNYIVNKKYLLPDGTLLSLTDSQKQVLFEIIYVWNEIFADINFKSFLQSKELYEPFEAHLGLPNRYNIPYGDIDPDYHKLYNEEYFGRLRLKLIEFRYWVLNYKENYNDIDEDELAVYIINLFPSEELSYLEYDVKIKILNRILKENFWIIGDWFFNDLNEEEALIKLVRSIYHETSNVPNYSDINKFLLLLNAPYDYSINQTLYEVLYTKINDGIIFDDDGNGNRGQFVKAVYQLWLDSKYNPYHEDSITADAALSNFTYTPYNCRWQANDPINYPFPLADENAAPMVINYESDKVLLWYIDNFKFDFYNNRIIANEDVENYGFQPYGVYDFFQPVSIKGASANDTIIKMPVLNMPIGTPNPTDFIKNCIPIFYLMYVDEVGDRSDAKETIGTAIDVVLTFTGVGGAVANLRHLKDLSLIRKLGVGLSLAEKEVLWRGVIGLTSASEAFFGAASFFHGLLTGGCSVYYNSSSPPQPGESGYLEYQRCQSIDKWLFALEILSLSGDQLARRQLRRASRELALTLSDDIPTQHRQVIDELADLDGLLSDFLESIQFTHPNVYTKVTNFTSQDKKFAFMFDFENKLDNLTELNSNVYLIDEWDLCFDSIHRKNVNFLKKCYKFSNSSTGWNHIRKGETKIPLDADPTSLAVNQTFSVNGYPNIIRHETSGIHTLSPPIPQEVLVVSISTPNAKGYFKAKVRTKVAGGWVNPTDANNATKQFAKTKQSTCFPNNWNYQKIKEEFAFADLNKKANHKTASNRDYVYESLLSDGTDCVIRFKSSGELLSFYPIID